MPYEASPPVRLVPPTPCSYHNAITTLAALHLPTQRALGLAELCPALHLGDCEGTGAAWGLLCDVTSAPQEPLDFLLLSLP